MLYRITVHRLDDEQAATADPIYEGTFDTDEDMADDIGEQAGNAIAEAVQCDVAAQIDGRS